MSTGSSDSRFVGSIPAVYESLLVPMIFAEPARWLSAAVAQLQPADVLETAAGTGVLTRELEQIDDVMITATDLNPAMLGAAQARLSSDRVRWLAADATDLPLGDGHFDVVVCQFGAMFFPDKVQGYAEAARVLRPGGRFLFSVWDRIETSPVAAVVTDALCAAAPAAGLDFLRRTPHGHHDLGAVERDLEAAGFEQVEVAARTGTSRQTARDGAVAYCQGTPLRGDIERSALALDHATDVAAEALAAQFGPDAFEAPTRWFEVTARRP